MYVAASRGREQLDIITDDVAELQGAVERSVERAHGVDVAEDALVRQQAELGGGVELSLTTVRGDPDGSVLESGVRASDAIVASEHQFGVDRGSVPTPCPVATGPDDGGAQYGRGSISLAVEPALKQTAPDTPLTADLEDTQLEHPRALELESVAQPISQPAFVAAGANTTTEREGANAPVETAPPLSVSSLAPSETLPNMAETAVAQTEYESPEVAYHDPTFENPDYALPSQEAMRAAEEGPPSRVPDTTGEHSAPADGPQSEPRLVDLLTHDDYHPAATSAPTLETSPTEMLSDDGVQPGAPLHVGDNTAGNDAAAAEAFERERQNVLGGVHVDDAFASPEAQAIDVDDDMVLETIDLSKLESDASKLDDVPSYWAAMNKETQSELGDRAPPSETLDAANSVSHDDHSATALNTHQSTAIDACEIAPDLNPDDHEREPQAPILSIDEDVLEL